MPAGRIRPGGRSLPMFAPYEELATLKPWVSPIITLNCCAVWIVSNSNGIQWLGELQVSSFTSNGPHIPLWHTTNGAHESNMICATLAHRNPVKERDPTCEWKSKMDLRQLSKIQP